MGSQNKAKFSSYILPSFLILWAFGLILYFFLNHANIISIFKISQTNPEVLQQITSRDFGLLSIYVKIFDSYYTNFSNFDYANFVFSIIGLSTYIFIGVLFISIIYPSLSRWTIYSLGFVIGMGILGVELEIAAIFGYLYRSVIIACYLLTIILIYIAIFKNRTTLSKDYITELGMNNPSSSQIYLIKLAKKKNDWNVFNSTLAEPQKFIQKTYYYLCLFAISVITLATFYHALFFPETYWDSMILYLGYARKIFYQHAFPVKVCAQVGIGLGANYPHLYPLTTAAIATVVGEWSTLFGQTAAPLAGLFTTILIYQMILRLSHNKIAAISMTLLFRAIPYGVAYSTYASDYAIAILFTTAFLFTALMYIETNQFGYFVLTTLITAFSVHINYLMWLLWGVWAVLVFLTPTKIFSLRFIFLFIITIIISSTWYVRNYIVTGNPVYAFFPEIFGGKNINIDVLRSAEIEWQLNGDGIGGFGKGFFAKIFSSWKFFVTDPNSWKLAPVFMGFTIPGVLIFIITLLKSIFNKEKLDDNKKFGIVVFTLFFLLIFYHYCIASMYLYQIIIILPAMIYFAYCMLNFSWNKIYRGIIYGMILFIGFFPGIPMSLMNFKFFGERKIGPYEYKAIDLAAFRNPMMDEEMFYQLVYGDDVKMWGYVNEHLVGQKLLTHENRHLAFDESIDLIHLDDWDIQKTYGMKTDAEKLAFFKEKGIKYYLYIPNEDKHPINKKVGIQKWTATPKLKQLYKAGDNVLYEIVY